MMYVLDADELARFIAKHATTLFPEIKTGTKGTVTLVAEGGEFRAEIEVKEK